MMKNICSSKLPLPKYVWKTWRNTTKAERLSCAAALITLIICIILILYYSIYDKKVDLEEPAAPLEWKITRQMWLAEEYSSNATTEQFNPLKLVIIQHTVSSECHTFAHCAAELRGLQSYYLRDKGYDIPYSFLIGNDGRVYEGRGWNREGAHTYGFNKCSVGIAFIGDYREELPVYTKVTDAQMNRTKLLLEEGIRKGYLVPNYFVVGAKDVRPTASPGSHLYNIIKEWDHYDKDQQFAGKNCSEIYGQI